MYYPKWHYDSLCDTFEFGLEVKTQARRYNTGATCTPQAQRYKLKKTVSEFVELHQSLDKDQRASHTLRETHVPNQVSTDVNGSRMYRTIKTAVNR